MVSKYIENKRVVFEMNKDDLVFTVFAFTDDNRGGNPAGVIINADGISSKEKQQIASNLGLSETAFVSRSEIADFKLDFFTPKRQIPHCGHATVAAFSLLSRLGLSSEKSSKETIDGIREISKRGDSIYMQQNSPVYSSVTEHEKPILASLGLSPDDLISGLPIISVSTGNGTLIVPVKDAAILKSLDVNQIQVMEISEQLDLVGIYVFCTEVDKISRDAQARMFAPRFGIPEESATGMAAGSLACYLHDVVKIKKTEFLIEQGSLMQKPSPSLIKVELELNESEISSLLVGGEARIAHPRLLHNNSIEIVNYEEKYHSALKDLNIEWITQYFEMEEKDYQTLNNPQEHILDKGGKIIIALENGIPSGVCILMRTDNPEYQYELAKMAVTPSSRGKNIGYLLGKAIISLAQKLGANKIFLESHSALIPALGLYKKLGFKSIDLIKSPYKRSDIQMEFIIDRS